MTNDDDGYFPRGTSVLRRVHEQRAVGLHYGQRALCIGALKPRNYVGTSLHSRHKATPFRRLAHTGHLFETVMFGRRAEADRVLQIVHRMHERVVGVLPQDAGPAYPAGTPYAALDPELMLWTIAVMMDSAACFHDLLVRPLGDAEREALWQDYRRFGALFGLPPQRTPPDHAAFRAWYAAQLAGDDLHLTPEARFMGHASAFAIPLPAHLQGAKRVHDLIMLGSLPPRVRELYGLRWTPGQQALFAALTRAMRAGRPLLPRRVRVGSCAASFDLVAATERRRIERGEPTPQVTAALPS